MMEHQRLAVGRWIFQYRDHSLRSRVSLDRRMIPALLLRSSVGVEHQEIDFTGLKNGIDAIISVAASVLLARGFDGR